ncbi:hypothetical protein VTJ49DRAFT_7726 [Mycothermus thermophilus]|uniref:F-box domain-containing protein n=1 Tax=Humicola insolens TaxID=85995 RepID=A0ABR3VGA9_HUMIN
MLTKASSRRPCKEGRRIDRMGNNRTKFTHITLVCTDQVPDHDAQGTSPSAASNHGEQSDREPEGSTSPAFPAATLPPPTPHLALLPNELLDRVISHLGEHELWAMALVSKRMNGLANKQLWGQMESTEKSLREVLFWAVKNGNHELMKTLLAKGASPAPRFWSPILRSRLMDVLEIQGRQRSLKPLLDRSTSIELFRAELCESSTFRKIVHEARADFQRVVPIEADMDFNVHNTGFARHGARSVPGVLTVSEETGFEKRGSWSWDTLHVAVLRGDITAVKTLLDHGAEIDSQACGACDCAADNLAQPIDPKQPVTPWKYRSVWTPLHLAMCSGHVEIVRLLVSRGASVNVGGFVVTPRPDGIVRGFAINAYESAATLGKPEMVEALSEAGVPVALISQKNNRGQDALHFAAAAGNVRRVGPALLQRPVSYIKDVRDPILCSRLMPAIPPQVDVLQSLCIQGRFDDALWLVQHRRNYTYRSILSNLPDTCTRTLGVVCCLLPPTLARHPSLRQRQDDLLRASPSNLARSERQARDAALVRSSRPSRIALARELLSIAAVNPNARVEVWADPVQMPSSQQPMLHRIRRTPLQIAAACGFSEMVSLLLARGATWNPNLTAPTQIPLVLAAAHAFSWGGDAGALFVLLAQDAAGVMTTSNPTNDDSIPCVLEVLHDLRPTYDPATCATDPRWNGWLFVIDTLLKHGAAHLASPLQYHRLVISAAGMAGNVPFVDLLDQARPITSVMGPTALLVFLHWASEHSLRAREGGLGQAAFQDAALVRWAARRCLDAGARQWEWLTHQAVLGWARNVEDRGARVIGRELREFAAELQ